MDLVSTASAVTAEPVKIILTMFCIVFCKFDLSILQLNLFEFNSLSILFV